MLKRKLFFGKTKTVHTLSFILDDEHKKSNFNFAMTFLNVNNIPKKKKKNFLFEKRKTFFVFKFKLKKELMTKVEIKSEGVKWKENRVTKYLINNKV